MAVSAYDQPTQSQFINTYIPIPFDQIVQAGVARQNRYDQQINQLETMQQEADMLNAMPGDVGDIDKVRNVLSNVRDTYYKRDLSDPQVQKELRNELRSGIDRGLVSRIQQSYAGYQKHEDARAQQRMMGVDLEPEDLSTYQTRRQGVFNKLPEQRLDHMKTAMQAFGDLDTQARAGTMGAYSGIHNEITIGHIRARAKTAAAEWLETPEGQQFVREERKAGDNRPDQAIAEGFMEQVGMRQLTSKFQAINETGNRDADKIPPQIFPRKQITGEEYGKKVTNPKKAAQEITKVEKDIQNLQTQFSNATSPKKREEISLEIAKLKQSIEYQKNLMEYSSEQVQESNRKNLETIRSRAYWNVLTGGFGVDENALLDYIEKNKFKPITQKPMTYGTSASYLNQTALSKPTLAEEAYTALTNKSWKDLSSKKQKAFTDAVHTYYNDIKNVDSKNRKAIFETYGKNVNDHLSEQIINISDLFNVSSNPTENGSLRLSDGDLIPSSMYNMVKSTLFDPEGSFIEPLKGTKDKGNKKLKELGTSGGDIKVLYLSDPSDKKSSYLVFATLDKDKIPTGDMYKQYTTNETEKRSVIADLINLGQTETAMRWANGDMFQSILTGYNNKGPFSVREGEEILNFEPGNKWGEYTLTVTDRNGNLVPSPHIYSGVEDIFYNLLSIKYNLFNK